MILCIKQYIIGHLEIMFLSWHYLTPNLLSNYGQVHGLRIYDPSKHHFYFEVIIFYPYVIVDSS
jgi:hypothetical protein